MKTSNIIRKEIDRTDLTNAEDVQFAALLYIENKEDIPMWLEEKILKRCRKYGFRFGEVIADIASSRVIAAEYAKKASRQSTAEKVQIKNFNKKGVFVEKLVGTGPEAIRLYNGELLYGYPGNNRTTKSLDARHKNDFISIKWTEDKGGAQDNQGADMLHFLEEATKYVSKHKDKLRFVAILDGRYYQEYWDKFSKYATNRILVETSDSYIAKCQRPKKNIAKTSVIIRHTSA